MDEVKQTAEQAKQKIQRMIDKMKSAVDEVFEGDYTHAPHSMHFDVFFGKITIDFNRENFNENSRNI